MILRIKTPKNLMILSIKTPENLEILGRGIP